MGPKTTCLPLLDEQTRNSSILLLQTAKHRSHPSSEGFRIFLLPAHTCGGASGFFVLLKLTCGIVQICQGSQGNEETERNYLSADGDPGIRQNWARGIQRKWWTIPWCLSVRSSCCCSWSSLTTAVCKKRSPTVKRIKNLHEKSSSVTTFMSQNIGVPDVQD